jgi:CheY-like chemotaxis protein
MRADQILVVDDNYDDRNIFATVLRFFGHEVLEAEDAVTALTLVHRHRPTLAVIDLSMPEFGGVDLARAIRGDPEIAGTNLIAVTVHRQFREVAEGAGFDLFLEKPVESQRFLEAIQLFVKAAEPPAAPPLEREASGPVEA